MNADTVNGIMIAVFAIIAFAVAGGVQLVNSDIVKHRVIYLGDDAYQCQKVKP